MDVVVVVTFECSHRRDWMHSDRIMFVGRSQSISGVIGLSCVGMMVFSQN